MTTAILLTIWILVVLFLFNDLQIVNLKTKKLLFIAKKKLLILPNSPNTKIQLLKFKNNKSVR